MELVTDDPQNVIRIVAAAITATNGLLAWRVIGHHQPLARRAATGNWLLSTAACAVGLYGPAAIMATAAGLIGWWAARARRQWAQARQGGTTA